ncbi:MULTISPECIES: hypothetical protein [Streptomyces]|uniref:Uncharacterized protein n=1 Tax=Streptomyces yaizuensis TaxID=2989713 RepID=A0AA86J418_9ACTN|nr:MULTISPECIES: hypothetical protein [Streptomyces]BDT39672.1 hypothetical protein SYYSPA8_37770 [Streptomyces sp. YSPA8]
MTTKKQPPSEAVRALLAEARADYERAQSPEMKAAVRLQQGQARTNGNAAAGAPGHRRS